MRSWGSAMANKHQVVDSRGQVHRRVSISRVYTHCVVIHIKPRDADANWRARPGYSRAEWAGSAALADKNAASWLGKPHVESVDVIALPFRGLVDADAVVE